MRPSTIATVLFLVSGSILPAAVSAQQPDTPPSVNEPQVQNVPVQPERAPQQSDQARKQENRSAEDTRLKQDWTTRRREDDRMSMDRMRERPITGTRIAAQ